MQCSPDSTLEIVNVGEVWKTWEEKNVMPILLLPLLLCTCPRDHPSPTPAICPWWPYLWPLTSLTCRGRILRPPHSGPPQRRTRSKCEFLRVCLYYVSLAPDFLTVDFPNSALSNTYKLHHCFNICPYYSPRDSAIIILMVYSCLFSRVCNNSFASHVHVIMIFWAVLKTILYLIF